VYVVPILPTSYGLSRPEVPHLMPRKP